MLELLNGAQIEAEHLGSLKGRPVYQVKKADFIKHYDDAQLSEVEGIYFVHESSSLFRHLIYKGNVVGHISKGGNVTWFKDVMPWEVMHRPIRVSSKPGVVLETKMPREYREADGGIADSRYIDKIMDELLAEGLQLCERLEGARKVEVD